MTFIASVKAATLRNLGVAFACLLMLMAASYLSETAGCSRGSKAVLCSTWFAMLVFFALPIASFFVANLSPYRKESFPWNYVYPLGWTVYAFVLWCIPAFVINIWFLFSIGAQK
jgi:hypothetical protein